MNAKRAILTLKVALWLGALSPAAWLLAGFFLDRLGANPIEKLEHVTGMSALVLLLVTLSVSPVRRITGWNPLIQLRRPLGLFAFFYACLHFSVWMALDLGFEPSWIAEDIGKRPYITVGFTGFLLLIPLAATSTKGWIRRLGRRWGRLHALIYVTTALGVIHFYWLVKSDVRLPLLLGAIFAALMGARVPGWLRRRGRAPGGPRALALAAVAALVALAGCVRGEPFEPEMDCRVVVSLVPAADSLVLEVDSASCDGVRVITR